VLSKDKISAQRLVFGGSTTSICFHYSEAGH